MGPTAIRRMSFAAIVIGCVGGTAAVMWAAIAWSHEHLITPRGWILVSGAMLFTLGCFLGPFGLARARDREHQADAAAAVERLQATADVLEPLVEPLLRTTGLTTTLADLAAGIKETNRRLATIEAVATIERSHAVFDRVVQAVVDRGIPQPRDGERIDRDAVWLAEMAEAMELGRKLEQRHQRPTQDD